MSKFPNVPNLPGVPPLLRNGLSAVSTVQGLVAGAHTIVQFFSGAPAKPVWGIFDSTGTSVVDADSFLSFDAGREANDADFQVQDGKFESYNKVVLPGRNSVRISKGGSLTDRANLLRQIDVLFESLDSFYILTPEKTYLNMNCERYTVDRRDKDAAYFLTDVNLYFREVLAGEVTFTNTDSSTSNAQAPSAQPEINNGVVQPGTPSPVVQSGATTLFSSD